MTYTVIWRYELIEAANPTEAAETAAMLLDESPAIWEYEVIDDATGEMTKVDLYKPYDEAALEAAELEALTGVRIEMDSIGNES
jgi:hypothetical protein